MRFPPKSYHQVIRITGYIFFSVLLMPTVVKGLESAEDRREREAQDMEYAKELAEEDEDLI